MGRCRAMQRKTRPSKQESSFLHREPAVGGLCFKNLVHLLTRLTSSSSDDSSSEDEEPATTKAPGNQAPYGYPSNVFAYAEPQSPNSKGRPPASHSHIPAYQYAQPSDFAPNQPHTYPYGHQGREDAGMARQPSYNAETREASGHQLKKSSSKDPQYAYASHPAYGNMPHAAAAASMPDYKNQSAYQYAQMPDSIKYTATPQTRPDEGHAYAKQAQEALQYQQYQQYYQYQQYQQQQQAQQAQQQEQRQKEEKKSKKSKKKDKESRKSRRHADDSDEAVLEPPKSPMLAARPKGSRHASHTLAEPADLSKKMHRLSVSGNRPDVHALGAGQLPPASPLLEAYQGTYQSLSPMPSPLMLPNDDIDDIPPLSPIKPRKKSGKLMSGAVVDVDREKKKTLDYDATDDAEELAEALTRSRVDNEILIDILPALSHDELMELKVEYKKQCKVQGIGINLAKHIKLKIPASNFGKICHVTALGRWQSEAEWANFWYQSNSARRELLIEALMGRSNAEIRAIKGAFKDKRYGNSLERCMDKELKADKFRQAVMWVLAERRQEEEEVWHIEYRNRDVETLYSAVRRREGGESAILQIVLLRSDAHLREVLTTYERLHGVNFARAALEKSNNLVVRSAFFFFFFPSHRLNITTLVSLGKGC